MENVLVTGGTGFIGRNLVSKLVKEGFSVVCTIHNNYPEEYSKNEKITCVRCSLSDEEKLDDIIKKNNIKVCYHLAWQGCNGESRGSFKNQADNITIALNLLNCLEKNKCEKLIVVGSMAEKAAVYSLKNNVRASNFPYTMTKSYIRELFAFETKKLNMKVAWCILPGIYGLDDSTPNVINFAIEKYLNKQTPDFGSGEQYYEVIEVADCIQGLLLVAENMQCSDDYYMGLGDARKFKEYILTIKNCIDVNCESGIGKREDDGVEFLDEWFEMDERLREWGYKATQSFEENILHIVNKKNGI